MSSCRCLGVEGAIYICIYLKRNAIFANACVYIDSAKKNAEDFSPDNGAWRTQGIVQTWKL